MVNVKNNAAGYLLIGRTLGPYQIVSQIGRGGSANVYKAYRPDLERYFALKVSAPQAARTSDFAGRFAREAEILHRLDHPHILPISEFGQQAGYSYIAMKYIDGGTLKEKLAQGLPDLPTTARLIEQIAAALDYAHRRGVLHRDVKPSNVLLDEGEQVRLTDFGLTKLMSEPGDDSTAGLLVGTPAYISPEQGQSLAVDHHTDIYALGVVLFQMVTGQLPYPSQTAMTIIFKHIHAPIPAIRQLNPALPIAVEPVIAKAMAKAADERYHSALDLAAAFRQAIASAPVEIRRPAQKSVPDDPSLEESPSIPHNLPSQPTPFVGRVKDLAGIQACLSKESCRILSLVGPGGIGKTRLAVEAGRRLIEHASARKKAKAGPAAVRFEDGLYFIGLASLRTADQLIPTIADRLGIPSATTDPETLRAQILSHLRDKRILMILDNFEHLLAGVGLLRDIVRTAPHVKFLITSRQRLNLPGEAVREIAGLCFPDNPHETNLAAYEAVQLFLENARRVQAGYVLPEMDKPGLVQICRLVEGMPLALELASSWVRVLSCAEIAAEIEQNLDFLAGESDDLPERHRSLRAVFAQSWNRLTEIERIILRKLSVFRGGFRRKAAAEVAGASPAHLMILTDKSFLRHGVGGRYELHEVLRQFTEEKLAHLPVERAQTRLHFVTYYTAFLRKRAADLKQKRQRRALQEIGAEIENIRRAWAWMVEQGRTAEIGQALDGLYQFYAIRSWPEEGVDLFGRAAQRIRDQAGLMHAFEPEAGVVYSKLLTRQGIFYRRLQDYGKARELLQKGLVIARHLGNKPEIALCLNQLGHVARLLGEIDDAGALYEEGLTIYQQLGDQSGIATTLRSLGLVAAASNGTAHKFHQESLSIFQSLGDEWGIARTLNELGKVACAGGDYHEAQSLYNQSLTISREIEDQDSIIEALINLGEVAGLSGDLAAADHYLQQGLTLSRQTNQRPSAVRALTHLGRLRELAGSYDEAHNFFQQSLMLSLKMKNH